MTIHYSMPHKRSKTTDEAAEVIKEAHELLEGLGYNSQTTDGMTGAYSSQSTFEQYASKLTEGLDADDAEEISELLENIRMTQLQGFSSDHSAIMESGISNIQPMAGLVGPMIRKLWPRLALKNAIPTQVVKVPKFEISYMVPYMQDKEGNRYELPQAMREMNNAHANRPRLSQDPIALPAVNLNLLTREAAHKGVGDAIDPNFHIVKVTMEVEDATGAKTDVVVDTDCKLSQQMSFFYTVTEKADDGTENLATLMGGLDLRTGVLNVNYTGATIKDIVVLGYLSTENNTYSETVGFDIKKRDYTIGTGAHLNAQLPVEFLTDVAAMYSIDGTLETTELMTQVFAQKTDQQFIEFLDNSYVNSKSEYLIEFSVKPSAQFANRPKEWREELKTAIDYVAEEMKQDTQFVNGEFVIIGNPIDLTIISNGDWSPMQTGQTRGGVVVNYSIGMLSGATNYRLVSSANVPRGAYRMIFIPSKDDQMTYKYFPYAFHVERGTYRGPEQTLLPNIMMTKRDKVDEFIPLQARIIIQDHDGKVPR